MRDQQGRHLFYKRISESLDKIENNEWEVLWWSYYQRVHGEDIAPQVEEIGQDMDGYLGDTYEFDDDEDEGDNLEEEYNGDAQAEMDALLNGSSAMMVPI